MIVVESGGEQYAGKFGEMTSWALKQSGATGIVLDSFIRDYLGLEVIPGFSVCARGTSPIESSQRWRMNAVNVTIGMPGTLTSRVKVNPGDWIVGEADGVIVIPQQIAMETLEKAEDVEYREQRMREDFAAGMGFDEAFAKCDVIACPTSPIPAFKAGEKSGAQRTVDHAHALGITVAAVPGMIDAPQAFGSNRLLREGAHVIAEPEDVLALLNVDARPLAQPMLSGDDAQLWDALSAGSADVATLARRAGLTSRSTAAAVSSLEISGLVYVDHLGHVHPADAVARV